MSRRAALWWIVAAAAVVAAALAVRWFVVVQGAIATDDAYVDAEQRVVTARIAGRVAAVPVSLHAHVRAGQVLVTLDDRDARARVALADDAVAQQQAAFASARADMRYAADQQVHGLSAAAGDESVARRHVATMEQQQLAAAALVAADRAVENQARAAVRQARDELPAVVAAERRAAADRTSARDLFEQGYSSRNVLGSADAAYARAHADVERAREAMSTSDALLAAARAKTAQDAASAAAADAARREATEAVSAAAGRTALSSSDQHTRSQAAHVVQAQAALDAAVRDARLARAQLADTRVAAPVDGWVAVRSVNAGQSVGPSDALFVVVPERGLYVTANFKETQLRDVRVGDRAHVHVDASGRTVDGHVDAIGASTMNMTSAAPPPPSNTFVKVVQRIPVRIAIDDASPGILRPGMSVEVRVDR